MSDLIKLIFEGVMEGDKKRVEANVTQAVNKGEDPWSLLRLGNFDGINELEIGVIGKNMPLVRLQVPFIQLSKSASRE